MSQTKVAEDGPLTWRSIGIFLTLLLWALASIFFVSGYSSSNYYAEYAFPDRSKASSEDIFGLSIVSTILATLQLAYLFIVLNEIVLVKPLNKIPKTREIWNLLFLLFSYILYSIALIAHAAHSDSWYKIFSYLGTGSLILAYVLWLYSDIDEYKRSPSGEWTGRVTWIVIDIMAIVALSAILFNKWQTDSQNLHDVFWKDVVVIFTIIAYSLLKWSQLTSMKARYVEIYDKFLVELEESRGRPSLSWSGNQVPNSIETLTSKESSCDVLDVGGGNGKRGIWLAKEIGLTIGQYTIVDQNGGWKQRFTREAEQSKIAAGKSLFVHEWGSISQDSKLYDVVIFGHVFYQNTSPRNFFKAIQKLKPGGIAIIRGYSPKSLFFVAAQRSGRFNLRTSYSWFWQRKYLFPWLRGMRKYGLKVVEPINPSGTVHVSLNLGKNDDPKKDEAVEALGDVICLFYGQTSKDYVDSLVEKDFYDRPQVCLDDEVYVFQKNEKL